MRAEALETAVAEHAKSGLLVGICGGMQMLGQSILDPDGVESTRQLEGLRLLPINMTMRLTKVTLAATGTLITKSLFGHTVGTTQVQGYEIHVSKPHKARL